MRTEIRGGFRECLVDIKYKKCFEKFSREAHQLSTKQAKMKLFVLAAVTRASVVVRADK